jgi:hypothetical protein
MALSLFHTNRRAKQCKPRTIKALKNKWRELRDPPRRSGQTEWTSLEQRAIDIHQEADDRAGVGDFGMNDDDDDDGDDGGDDGVADDLSGLLPSQATTTVRLSPPVIEDIDVTEEIEANQLSQSSDGDLPSPSTRPQGQVPRSPRRSLPASSLSPAQSASPSSSSSSPVSMVRSKALAPVPLFNDPTFQKRVALHKQEEQTSSLIQYMIYRDEERRKEEKVERTWMEEVRRKEREEREAREERLRDEAREEAREERRIRESREARQHQELMLMLARSNGITASPQSSSTQY